MSDSVRLDVALVAAGLARSRGQAAELIRAGRVFVDGVPCRKPAQRLDPGAVPALDGEADPWVSRAAHKLLGALDASGVSVPARVLDAGASTGGFTQVLLARGAERVYAVDVGHDQLAPVVRADPRVSVREGLNLRALTMADLDGAPVDLVVADVSFISLTLLVEPLLGVLTPSGEALLMVKPQFEVGRAALDSHGVVSDTRVAAHAVDAVVDAAARVGWSCVWRGESPLQGASGNREWFVRLQRPAEGVGPGQ